jgi:hypothetical protein
MSKKPSTRIEEIRLEMAKRAGQPPTLDQLVASTIAFLDEQWERGLKD